MRESRASRRISTFELRGLVRLLSNLFGSKMKYVAIALSLCFAGCAEFGPRDPASKLNSSTNNVSANNDRSGQNNVGNNGAGELLAQFGTEGPSDNNPTSPGGDALCALEDIRTTDLEGGNESNVGSSWGTVAADTPGRCGDDRETVAWRLMNCERIARQITPFDCDLRMVWMGREHSLDMIARDYFSHSNPDGESPFDRMARHGVGFRGAAENIALGADALQSHLSWMDSTGHRGNILGEFTHAGVGSEDSPSGLLSTSVFINPQ